MGNPLTIVICDDEEIAISIVSASVEALFTSRGIQTEIESFTSPGKCFEYIRKNDVNLLFLDIAMPEEDGIELGKQIMELKEEDCPEIVFVSSNQDRVFDSFAVHPYYTYKHGNCAVFNIFFIFFLVFYFNGSRNF